MKLNLDQLEVVLSKFGFRHFRTIFFSDGSIEMSFRRSSFISCEELRQLRILGFTLKAFGGYYVVSAKSACHD